MRGHIRRRGKDSWAIVIDRGRDANGKRCQKWHTVRGTKKHAQRELAAMLHQMDTGSYVEPNKLTVCHYLDVWLRLTQTKVSAKTFERYDEIVRQHLIPALGHHLLNRLQPLHIETYYLNAQTNGRRDGNGGLSAQTVLHHHRVLHNALRHAVQLLLHARNPADAVEPPRPLRPHVRTVDEEQSAVLLRALAGSRLHGPTLLALATGLRRGELLALTWANVDFDKALITVCQSLQQTNGGVSIKEPKSGRGRQLALPTFAVEALRAQRAQQAEERLLLGPGYVDNDLVFPRYDGSFWEPDSFTSSFAAAVRKSGVMAVNFHALRHSHATILLKQGVNPKVVSERLGHAKVGTTLDIYSHVLPSMQEQAAQGLDRAFRRAMIMRK